MGAARSFREEAVETGRRTRRRRSYDDDDGDDDFDAERDRWNGEREREREEEKASSSSLLSVHRCNMHAIRVLIIKGALCRHGKCVFMRTRVRGDRRRSSKRGARTAREVQSAACATRMEQKEREETVIADSKQQ